MEINLDFEKKTCEIIQIKQFDDRTLTAFLFQNGIPYDLTGCSIQLNLSNCDGGVVNQTQDIVITNNKVVALLKKDFTRVYGISKMEIVVIKSGKQLSTFTFKLDIEPSVLGSGTLQPNIVVDVIEVLTSKINEAVAAKEETKQLIATGNAATKGDIATINEQLDSKASKEYVNDEISKIPKPDMSQYTTKAETANVQTQVNELVINGTGTSNPEVVQARSGYAVLNERLNVIESVTGTAGFSVFDGKTVQGNINSDTGLLVGADETTRLCTDFIDVSKTTVVTTNYLTVVTGTNNYNVSLYDSKKTFIKSKKGLTVDNFTTDGAYYIRFNLKAPTPFQVDVSRFTVSYKVYKGNLKDKLDNLNNIVMSDGVLLLDFIIKQGSIEALNGAVVGEDDITRKCTDFIDIGEKAKYDSIIYTNLLALQGTGACVFNWYDENKTFIKSDRVSLNYCLAPQNAKYVRFNLTWLNVTIADLTTVKIYYTVKGAMNKINSNIALIKSLNNRVALLEDKDKIEGFISIKAYDFNDISKTDDEIIKNALDFISIYKYKEIIFDTKQWNISKPILIDSNTTVIIDGVTIKQKDYMFDNVFRPNTFNLNPNNPHSFPLSIDWSENIKILGKNNAKIEGCDNNYIGTHHNLGANQVYVGDDYGYKTLQICFSKTKNFEIANIEFTKTRCWCISMDKCSHGSVHDLKITSSAPNGDGVDIRSGCNNINVYNIQGSTEDDTVACTAIDYASKGFPTGDYMYPMEPSAFEDIYLPIEDLYIHDINIDNITTTGSHHAVICLSNAGRKVFNISINNIIEPTPSNRESVVRIYTGYGTGYVDNDINNIRVNNVVSKGATYSVLCNAKVNNVWFNKLKQEKVGGALTSITNMNGITITNS